MSFTPPITLGSVKTKRRAKSVSRDATSAKQNRVEEEGEGRPLPPNDEDTSHTLYRNQRRTLPWLWRLTAWLQRCSSTALTSAVIRPLWSLVCPWFPAGLVNLRVQQSTCSDVTIRQAHISSSCTPILGKVSDWFVQEEDYTMLMENGWRILHLEKDLLRLELWLVGSDLMTHGRKPSTRRLCVGHSVSAPPSAAVLHFDCCHGRKKMAQAYQRTTVGESTVTCCETVQLAVPVNCWADSLDDKNTDMMSR